MEVSSMMRAGVRVADEIFDAVDGVALSYGDVEFGGLDFVREFDGDVKAWDLAPAELDLSWGSVAMEADYFAAG